MVLNPERAHKMGQGIIYKPMHVSTESWYWLFLRYCRRNPKQPICMCLPILGPYLSTNKHSQTCRTIHHGWSYTCCATTNVLPRSLFLWLAWKDVSEGRRGCVCVWVGGARPHILLRTTPVRRFCSLLGRIGGFEHEKDIQRFPNTAEPHKNKHASNIAIKCY